MSDPHERMELVRAELQRRREEEEAAGVSTRARRYSWNQLEKAIGHTKGAIRNFLDGGSPGGDDFRARYDAWGVREGVLAPLPRMGASDAGEQAGGLAALEMPEVWRRIDEISRLPGVSDAVRSIRIEQILAAGRMALQHKETRAAEARTRVIERETDVAERRTEAVEREGERADLRLSVPLSESGATATLSAEELKRRAQAGHRQAVAIREASDEANRRAGGGA